VDVDVRVENLLPKVKANAISAHEADDALLRSIIRAALDYAKTYQKIKRWTAANFAPSTEQAVIMLATHFYESRDGSTGGFFADNTNASAAVWATVNRLLQLNKNVEV
jgi:hypothetical protein